MKKTFMSILFYVSIQATLASPQCFAQKTKTVGEVRAVPQTVGGLSPVFKGETVLRDFSLKIRAVANSFTLPNKQSISKSKDVARGVAALYQSVSGWGLMNSAKSRMARVIKKNIDAEEISKAIHRSLRSRETLSLLRDLSVEIENARKTRMTGVSEKLESAFNGSQLRTGGIVYSLSEIIAGGKEGNWVSRSASRSHRFLSPAGLALDSTGDLYVSDYDLNRVLVFRKSRTGRWRYTGQIGTGKGVDTDFVSPLPGRYNLVWPNHVAIDAIGRIYVSDRENHEIKVFRQQGDKIRFLARSYAIGYPKGIAIGPSGLVYVISDTNQLHVLGWEGGSLKPVYLIGNSNGRRGQKNARFKAPDGVAVDAWERVYVADTDNHRIQIFRWQGGKLLYQTTLPGDFLYPKGIAIDPKTQRLAIADTGHKRVLIYSIRENKWSRVDSIPRSPGSKDSNRAASLTFPYKLTFDAEGALYVTDRIALIDHPHPHHDHGGVHGHAHDHGPARHEIKVFKERLR